MSFWDKIWKVVSNPIGAVVDLSKKIFGTEGNRNPVQSAAGSVVNKVFDRVTDNVVENTIKVPQIPTPDPKYYGKEQGVDMKNYMDQAFPGTTPWERLGIGSPPSIAIEGMKQGSAIKMKQQELANNRLLNRNVLAMEKYKTDKNALVQALGFGSPYGVRGMKAMVNALKGRETNDYTTQIRIMERRLREELKNMKVERVEILTRAARNLVEKSYTGTLNEIQKARAKVKDILAELELKGLAAKSPITIIMNAVDNVMRGRGQLLESNRFKKFVDGSYKASAGERRFYKDYSDSPYGIKLGK